LVNVKFVVATSIKLNEFAWTEGGDYASNDTGNILAGALLEPGVEAEVGAFYWTVLTPDIVNLGREEQGSVSV